MAHPACGVLHRNVITTIPSASSEQVRETQEGDRRVMALFAAAQ
jgi:hypothetical protein